MFDLYIIDKNGASTYIDNYDSFGSLYQTIYDKSIPVDSYFEIRKSSDNSIWYPIFVIYFIEDNGGPISLDNDIFELSSSCQNETDVFNRYINDVLVPSLHEAVGTFITVDSYENFINIISNAVNRSDQMYIGHTFMPICVKLGLSKSKDIVDKFEPFNYGITFSSLDIAKKIISID